MNLISKQDIKTPAEHVFQQLADFDFYESYAMRLGATVERLDDHTVPQTGMRWRIRGMIRGQERDVDLTLDGYNPSESLNYVCKSNSIHANIRFDIIPLSRTETRMKVSLKLSGNSIAARVALQSAKLAKKSLDKKFNNRMHDFARKIQDKYHG